ncbi:MAG: hypothetical protein H6621_12125 [Halobacteriovoraceae bacterium]|nr:hypothetical protein [Halobacteriovoraceae bacterium]MCB9095807.1 hypothetical protein [Halobacteriovoraceae bacterium]
MRNLFIFFIFQVLIFETALAQQQYRLEGGIPLSFGGEVASDLLDQDGHPLNSPLLIEKKLYEWNGDFDFSLLDPEKNYYWQNEYQLHSDNSDSLLNAEDDKIRVSNLNTVKFIGHDISALGEAIAIVEKNGMLYRIHFRHENYQTLMLKTLLRKLGYTIPATKRISRLRVEFSNLDQKKLFNIYYQNQFGDQAPLWILSQQDEEPSLLIQDIVLTSDESSEIPNLALAPLLDDKETHKKRIFRSLLVPYAITNFKGFINLFGWTAATVESENIFLDHHQAPSFGASVEDLKWITRRIQKFSREDWKDVVSATQLPATIQKVLTEKLISRFNSVADYLSIDLPLETPNYKISHTNELIEGKVLRCDYPGYAFVFCGDDPEPPFSSKDFWPLLKSKAATMSYKSVFAFLNSRKFMRTDFSKNNSENLNHIISKAILDFENTGKETNILKESWDYNFKRFFLSADRKLVAGRYQGSDQLLSQVDSVTISAAIGNYRATTGYNDAFHPKNFYPNNGAGPVTNIKTSPVSLQAGGYLNIVWAHVTPVYSIKDANKLLPIERAFLPILKRERGNLFKDIEIEYQTTEDDSEKIQLLRNKANEKLLELKETLRIGESFIVMKSLSAGVNARVNGQYKKLAELEVGAGSDYQVLDRLHLYRAGEDTIHIYKSFGNLSHVQVASELSSFSVPYTRFHFQGIPDGTAHTDFYSLRIPPNDPLLIEKVIALRHILTSGSLKALKEVLEKEKYRFQYEFNQKLQKIGVFWFNFNRIKSTNRISVSHPPGSQKEKAEEKRFLRNYFSKVKGKNIANYGVEILESLLSKIAKVDINLIEPALNPGFSFSGQAENEIAIYEAELDEQGDPLKQFVHTQYVFNGWSATREKFDRFLSKVEKRYHYNFFPHNELQETQKMKLYHLAVHLYVFDQGIEHFTNLSDQEIEDIYTRYPINQEHFLRQESKIKIQNLSHILAMKKQFIKLKNKKKWKKMAKHLNKMLLAIQGLITIEGLKELLGGDHNFYLYAGIGGFREGVQTPGLTYDSSIKSKTFGTLDEFFEFAPDKYSNTHRDFELSLIEKSLNSQRKLGISRGELFINWILDRVY